MLEGMGEDPDRDGLKKTPERVAEFYAELTEGMWQDAKARDRAAAGRFARRNGDCQRHFDSRRSANIISRRLSAKCHIAYIPKNGRIVGLSKLARIAEIFAQQLAGAGTSDAADRADAF